ncbi:putative mutator-like element protein [Zalerion maritima]|uniref:Mutator-like element protein n=1 Tax=Zalerion maritima TaxID=339359 RepID=A0AAD5WSW9_9PEZI|nr:putative mutator-like element protein [Zalerion maritima]
MSGLGQSGTNSHPGLTFGGMRRSYPQQAHSNTPNKPSPATQHASPYQPQSTYAQQPSQGYPHHLFPSATAPSVPNVQSVPGGVASVASLAGVTNLPNGNPRTPQAPSRRAPSRSQMSQQQNPPMAYLQQINQQPVQQQVQQLQQQAQQQQAQMPSQVQQQQQMPQVQQNDASPMMQQQQPPQQMSQSLQHQQHQHPQHQQHPHQPQHQQQHQQHQPQHPVHPQHHQPHPSHPHQQSVQPLQQQMQQQVQQVQQQQQQQQQPTPPQVQQVPQVQQQVHQSPQVQQVQHVQQTTPVQQQPHAAPPPQQVTPQVQQISQQPAQQTPQQPQPQPQQQPAQQHQPPPQQSTPQPQPQPQPQTQQQTPASAAAAQNGDEMDVDVSQEDMDDSLEPKLLEGTPFVPREPMGPMMSPPPEGGSYPTLEAVHKAVLQYCTSVGYAIVIGRSKKTVPGLKKVLFVCDRAGKPPTRVTPELRKRKTSSRKCDCQFGFFAIEQRTQWTVRYRPDSAHLQHNHGPSESPLLHPAARKLDSKMVAAVKQLKDSGVGVSQTLEILQSEHPHVPLLPRDIYNARAAINRNPTKVASGIAENRPAIYSKPHPTAEERIRSDLRKEIAKTKEELDQVQKESAKKIADLEEKLREKDRVIERFEMFIDICNQRVMVQRERLENDGPPGSSSS